MYNATWWNDFVTEMLLMYYRLQANLSKITITYKQNEFALGHTFGAKHTSISMDLYNDRSLYQARCDI